ncbi:MAG: hypothetical protein KC491_16110 [Dehalococcoidia bacterium]|nr:hypothetical protein [Dehalococcoidia bacterium]
MGGTERDPKKPRPSYEDGKLRDAELAGKIDPAFRKRDLTTLIAKAAKPQSRKGS